MGRLIGCCAVVVAWSCAFIGTAAPSNTTEPSRGGTDASAAKTAAAAVAVLPDLGAGWTEYQKAAGLQKFPKNDCTIKAGAPVSASDKGYAGAIYTDATKQMFVYSSATVFRTAADAKAYTAVLTTPAFQKCRVARDDAAQKKANATTFVKINDTSTSAIGTFPGFEAFYSEYGGNKNSDGSDALSAEYLRYTYRHGRVVYTVKVDASLASDEAGSIELANRIGDVVGAINAAVEARLTAAGV